MSWEVDTALVQNYHANIELQFQQMQSRLEPWVRVEDQSAEFDYYDRVGPTEVIEVVDRHGDTPLVSTPHSRRKVGLRDFDWADLIDRKDKIRMLADPTSIYTLNAVAAFNRKKDDLLIEAAFDSAWTGKHGDVEVTFPATQEIAVNYVENGGAVNSGLTPGKLRRARYLFDKAEVTGEGGEADLFIVVDPQQIQDMLQKEEVTSSDYNSIKALVNGNIDQWMGFKWVKSNRLDKTAGVRDCIVGERGGLMLAKGMEIVVDVGPRRDKRNSVQVYVCANYGSTRMWEEKIIKLKCLEP
jgi:hypothetical protein